MLRSPGTWIAASWLIGMVCALAFLAPLAMLFDSDSYYHLAVAREYAHRGLFSDLSWARFSVMHHGFGDKELLFHVLLAPFALLSDSLAGAKFALALLIAGLVASVARSAVDAVGPTGLWLPALLLGGSMSFDLRLIRLRPELLALLLLLSIVRALTLRRYRLVAVLALLFALAYTALQVLVGVVMLCFGCAYWLERRPDLRLLAWPLSAALLGLCLHPHFPHNLQVFYLQNVAFWRFTDHADVGTEIQALGWLRFLRFDWPLLLGVIALALSFEPKPNAARESAADDAHARRCAWFYTAVALPFGIGFVHSARFALYALPFSLLALAWFGRSRGWQPSARLARLGANAPRTGLVLALIVTISVPLTAAALTSVVDHGGCLWPAQRSQLEALGRAVPQGARIAAPWQVTDDYVYFAPQGRYLNVLDPIFMRAAQPQAYEVQRRLFNSELLDVPLAVVGVLDSDYLAFDAPASPRLQAQLAGDPRVEPLIAGGQALYRMVPNANRAFVLDYRVADSRERALRADAPSYPRAQRARERAVEAFVEFQSARSATGCQWFVPSAQLPPGAKLEFDASVPASVWFDDQLRVRVARHARLAFGHGQAFALPERATNATLSIEVCSRTPAAFYLRRMDPRVAD